MGTGNTRPAAQAMPDAHALARGHPRLRALIEFGLREGWRVERVPGGHLRFSTPGGAVIYTGARASGRCAIQETAPIVAAPPWKNDHG